MREPPWKVSVWKFGRWLGDLAEPAMVYSPRWWKRIAVGFACLLVLGVMAERWGETTVFGTVGMLVGTVVVWSWVMWWIRRKDR
jgi:undecaprenyl pyrophosphate phosphatase UppP